MQIRILTADNYLCSKLLSKYYIIWKEHTKIAKGGRMLNRLLTAKMLRNQFLNWRYECEELRNFLNSSKMEHNRIMLYQCFAGWKQESIKSKLAKIFQLRILMRSWLKYVREKRIIIPYNIRYKFLSKLTIKAFSNLVKNAWKKRRSMIMKKKLIKIRNEKLAKLVLISFLENVMQEKKYFNLTNQETHNKPDSGRVPQYKLTA